MSVTFSLAEKSPAAEGENVTLILQVSPAASVIPHVVVSPKAAAFAPEIAMAILVSAPVPVLPRVMVCAPDVVPAVCDAKVREGGDKLTAGAL